MCLISRSNLTEATAFTSLHSPSWPNTIVQRQSGICKCSQSGFAVYHIFCLLFRSTAPSLGAFSTKMEDGRLKSCWNRCGASCAFPIVNTLWEDCWGNGESYYTQVITVDGLYYYAKGLFAVSEWIIVECYGLLKVIFLNHLSFGGCSAGCKKSNDSMRLIITTFVGIVFGFFVGASFPTLSLIKVSHLVLLIHFFIFRLLTLFALSLLSESFGYFSPV